VAVPDPPAIPSIPDKLYFRIGEVARLAAVKPHVLRFWETEFSFLDPKKSGTNHRLYRRKDVETVLEIKRLLYEQRFTIEGARKHLAAAKQRPDPAPARRAPVQPALFDDKSRIINEIRDQLQSLLEILR
jgi:DNA-binding transcriptional MerR regulator